MDDVDFIYAVVNARSHETVGTAFLFAPRFLMTCAHVVSQALVGSNISENLEGKCISLKRDPRVRESFEATVRFYDDLSNVGLTRDIAILELPKVFPGVDLPAFDFEELIRGSEIESFGFLPDVQNGVHSQGKLIGPDKQDWWQCERLKVHGSTVRGGMSGAPVFSAKQNFLIGMISSADSNQEYFHFIPSALLRDAIRKHNERKRGPYAVFRLKPKTEGELINGLLELNFAAQMGHWTKFDSKQCSAVIVGGPSRHGQELIGYRISSKRFEEKPRIIPVEYGLTGPPQLEAVFNSLAQFISARNQGFTHARILTGLSERLRRYSILLLLRTGSLTRSNAMTRFFEEVWKPVVDCVKNSNIPYHRKLLLLVIDESGAAEEWRDLQTANGSESLPISPIALPTLSFIQRNEVTTWIKTHLPRLDNMFSAAIWTEAIWPLSGDGTQTESGIPEDLCEGFCDL